jgi:Rad3-related DNA helicase
MTTTVTERTRLSFDGTGPLAAALRRHGRNPSRRGSQQEFVEHLNQCLDRRLPAFIDAEAGVGKTLGYLVPLMERAASLRADGSRPVVVVSTATVALQKQVLNDDLPVAVEALEAATGHRLTAAYRVGRQQVVDRDALVSAADELAQGDAERDLVEEMIAWCEAQLADGALPLRSDLVAQFADRFEVVPGWLTPDLVALQPGHPDAHPATDERFRHQLAACEAADVLVVNHHLLALHILRPFLWQPDRPAFIAVDEADRLGGALEHITRAHVPFHRLRGLAEGGVAGRDALRSALDHITALTQDVWSLAWTKSAGGVLPLGRVDPAKRGELLEAVATVDESLNELIRDQQLRYGGGRSAEVRERLATLERYHAEIRRFWRTAQAGDNGRALLVYSPVRRFPGIACDSEGVGRLIARRLWSEPETPTEGLVFTSATLSTLAHGAETAPRRALAAFLAQTGFDTDSVPPDTCAVIAPQRFGEMSFMRPALDFPAAIWKDKDEGAGDEVPLELDEQATGYWCRMVEAAASEGGRTLVLVPSMRDVTAIRAELEHLDARLVIQLPGFTTDATVKRFLAGPDTVWVSASAWEGVSLPGAISHVVIPRLPIPPRSLGDTLLELYFDDVMGSVARGEAVVFGRRMAAGRRRLRQGIGRGIRAHDDRVKVWLGDPRWPLSQREADEHLLDQPQRWSTTMLNAVPARFRKKLETAPRFPW